MIGLHRPRVSKIPASTLGQNKEERWLRLAGISKPFLPFGRVKPTAIGHSISQYIVN